MTVVTATGVSISALPAATVPLDGSEIVPIVQGGVTKKADVSAFASGVLAQAITLAGVRAAALAAGVTNDWAADLSDVSRLNITAAGAASLTGLAGGTDGRLMILTNVAAADITIFAESGLSTAANRFVMNGDILLFQNWSAMFIYVAAISRWSKIGP